MNSATNPSIFSTTQAWLDELEKLLELPDLPPVKAGEIVDFGNMIAYKGQSLAVVAETINKEISDALDPKEFGIREIDSELLPEGSRLVKGILIRVSLLGLVPWIMWNAVVSPLLKVEE